MRQLCGCSLTLIRFLVIYLYYISSILTRTSPDCWSERPYIERLRLLHHYKRADQNSIRYLKASCFVDQFPTSMIRDVGWQTAELLTRALQLWWSVSEYLQRGSTVAMIIYWITHSILIHWASRRYSPQQVKNTEEYTPDGLLRWMVQAVRETGLGEVGLKDCKNGHLYGT
jgi:hypothetical protein